jgi:hypothetical protein
VVGFTTGSRGKVPGRTCEKRIRNNNNNNALIEAAIHRFHHTEFQELSVRTTATLISLLKVES